MIQLSIPGHRYNLTLIYIPVRLIECELHCIIRHFRNLTKFASQQWSDNVGSIIHVFHIGFETEINQNEKNSNVISKPINGDDCIWLL